MFILISKNFKFSLLTPMNLSYWWNLGSLMGVLMMIQIFSGFLLTFYYESSSEAFYSVWIIHMEVFFGSTLHYIHLNFASFIFFFMYAHIIKGLLFNSYMNLSSTWMSGWVIMFLLMMTAFLGYVLPWGQMSLWGATVITNLISAFPFGDQIVKWIWSGYFVGLFTMKLFFSLHFILPLLILILMMIHIIFLHYMGSSNPLGGFQNSLKNEFMPIFFIKDMLNLLIILLLTIFLLTYPYKLGDAENFVHSNSLVSPIHIQPEWYFLQYYAILRAIPNKLGGVIFFGISLILILFLIYMKNHSNNILKMDMLFKGYFISMNLVLMFLGGSPVEYPYLILSQIFSALYFFWFLYMYTFSKTY